MHTEVRGKSEGGGQRGREQNDGPYTCTFSSSSSVSLGSLRFATPCKCDIPPLEVCIMMRQHGTTQHRRNCTHWAMALAMVDATGPHTRPRTRYPTSRRALAPGASFAVPLERLKTSPRSWYTVDLMTGRLQHRCEALLGRQCPLAPHPHRRVHACPKSGPQSCSQVRPPTDQAVAVEAHVWGFPWFNCRAQSTIKVA